MSNKREGKRNEHDEETTPIIDLCKLNNSKQLSETGAGLKEIIKCSMKE